MKSHHSVPEGHQCPKSVQKIETSFQKSEITGVIYFQMRLRKPKKVVEISLRELMVLKVLSDYRYYIVIARFF